MARYKEFNQDVVLDKAMKLFWQHGYEATSTKILLDGMGIGRGSFYDTFGSKHDLYIAALNRYIERQSEALDSIADPNSTVSMTAMEKIRAIFDSLIEEASSREGNRGCMVVNSIVELAHKDTTTKKTVRQTVDAIANSFSQLIFEGQEDGSLSIDNDVTQISHALVNTFLGIRVLAKMSPERQVMQDSVDAALSLLNESTISS